MLTIIYHPKKKNLIKLKKFLNGKKQTKEKRDTFV